MQILIDADGCPVVDLTLKLAHQKGVEVLLICDTAHSFERPEAKTITVEKGADSVDFALVNLLQPGDIVITQDYGLAAMCLARRGVPLNQNGLIYTEENIDALLLARHTAKKIRNAGGRLKGPKKRSKEQNECFCRVLEALLEKSLPDQKGSDRL